MHPAQPVHLLSPSTLVVVCGAPSSRCPTRGKLRWQFFRSRGGALSCAAEGAAAASVFSNNRRLRMLFAESPNVEFSLCILFSTNACTYTSNHARSSSGSSFQLLSTCLILLVPSMVWTERALPDMPQVWTLQCSHHATLWHPQISALQLRHAPAVAWPR